MTTVIKRILMNNLIFLARIYHLLQGLLSILTVFISQAGYSQEKNAVAPARAHDGINNLLSVPGDENWDNQMGFPQSRWEQSGHAIALIHSEIYLGGFIPAISNFARWNVNHWSALAGGPVVDALAVIGNDLYVGGSFIKIGSDVFNRIARWNRLTQKWAVLKNDTTVGIDSHQGVYLSSGVSAMAVRGHDLYMGGKFTYAGGIVANNIVKWNSLSNRWFPLGDGINGTVSAIAVCNGEIYIGGRFSTAGDVPANNVAKWNGHKWSALGSGVNNIVKTISCFGKEIYVGGSFTEAGDVQAQYIAKWNPVDNRWSALGGNGVSNGSKRVVLAIGSNKKFVYVGGDIDLADGQKIIGMAKWDPVNNLWSAMGSGVYGWVKSIVTRGNDVFVAGTIEKVGGKDSKNFGVWHEPPNHPPILSQIPEITFNEDDSLLFPISNWFDYVSDVENADSGLFFRIFSSEEVKAIRRDKSFLFTAAPNWYGIRKLKVRVKDRRQLTDSTWLVVHVKSVNDAPVLQGLPDSLSFHNTAATELNLWEFAHDVETPDSLLQFTFAASQNELAINFDQKTGKLKLSAADFVGANPLYVTVKDWKQVAARDTIVVRVRPAAGLAKSSEPLPTEFVLQQNYPNPFNPTTLIRFGLPQESHVQLEIYNLAGHRVATLLNQQRPAGYHAVEFDGRQFSSGTYFYRITADQFSTQRKLLLIK